MTHVVVGAGQVGTALAEVLGCDLVDLAGPLQQYDVMHVAFPWSETFEDEVRAHAMHAAAGLVVIHSTVPVGTSRRLGAVHSPVTGRHPDLVPSLRAFPKFFGGERAQEAAAAFAVAGCAVECVPDPETTEAGKLWATLQFGWLVALEKEARSFCEQVGADPDIAYCRFNEAYNTGYASLGETYRLPVLRHIDGPIGGHCVIPNARMTGTRIADLLVGLDGSW